MSPTNDRNADLPTEDELPEPVITGVDDRHGPLGTFEPLAAVGTNGTEPPAGTGLTPHSRRRGLLRLSGLVFATLLVAVAAFLHGPRDLFTDDDVVALPVRDTAVAGTSTLVEGYDADGQIVYADAVEITAAGPVGVVTAIVEPETTVRRGEVLWRIVDEPVAALFGDTPASRTMSEGVDGTDVLQLEENLVTLGYDPDRTVTVDGEYTAYTAAMVERWQEDIGAEVTGIVEDGAVVFVPGISRVGATEYDVGDTVTANAVVLSITAPGRLVEFTVPASERDTISIDDSVSTRLPDGSTMDAVVTTILFRDNGGIDVLADLRAPISYAGDTVPVAVSWEVPIGSDVLTVPAGALIRTDDGRYNVEVRRPTGVEELVPVEVGRASGVTVEIIGNIAEGDVVIAP